MTKKDLVKEVWDNAYEYGYAEWLNANDPETIAVDMMDCSEIIFENFENDFGTLVELVTEIKANL